MCLTGEDYLWDSKFIYISPKTGIKQIEQFNMPPGLRKKAQDAALRFLTFSSFSRADKTFEILELFEVSVYSAIYKMNRGFEIF